MSRRSDFIAETMAARAELAELVTAQGAQWATFHTVRHSHTTHTYTVRVLMQVGESLLNVSKLVARACGNSEGSVRYFRDYERPMVRAVRVSGGGASPSEQIRRALADALGERVTVLEVY